MNKKEHDKTLKFIICIAQAVWEEFFSLSHDTGTGEHYRKMADK